MSWKFVLSLIFALIVAVFAIQNADPVVVTLLFKKSEISQALIILISAVLGALIVALLGLINQMKLKAVIRDNKKVIAQLEKQVCPEPTEESLSETVIDGEKKEKTGQPVI